VNGLLLALLLTLAVFAALWKFTRLPAPWLGVTALILAMALAGYAGSGSPGLHGRPHPPREDALRADTLFATERRQLLEQLGDVGAWLNYADALERAGATQYAVRALQEALRRNPGSADLWVGLGNALAVHAGGFVTPASRMAFNRAARLAPDHPGPPYYLGLALLQGGRPDEALAEWQALADRASPDAPWLPLLRSRIAAVQAALATPERSR
jgi:cytochrome c-type biogenesis protein CcmH